MICGSGKNVGKTTLSSLLVKYFSDKGKRVYALKTSSHLHQLDKDECILKEGEDYAVVKESRKNNKDSSLLLQAGAEESYYIQASDKHTMFSLSNELVHQFPTDAIFICESGGLREYIRPALFLFVLGDKADKNMQYQPEADYELRFGEDFNNQLILNKYIDLERFI